MSLSPSRGANIVESLISVCAPTRRKIAKEGSDTNHTGLAFHTFGTNCYLGNNVSEDLGNVGSEDRFLSSDPSGQHSLGD